MNFAILTHASPMGVPCLLSSTLNPKVFYELKYPYPHPLPLSIFPSHCYYQICRAERSISGTPSKVDTRTCSEAMPFPWFLDQHITLSVRYVQAVVYHICCVIWSNIDVGMFFFLFLWSHLKSRHACEICILTWKVKRRASIVLVMFFCDHALVLLVQEPICLSQVLLA